MSFSPTANAGNIAAWTKHTYDPTTGNRVTTTRVNEAATGTGPTWTFTYDTSGLNVQTMTRTGDLNGDGIAGGPEDTNQVTLAYDALGRQITGLRADWYQPTFAYDARDRMIQGTDAVGQSRTLAYDGNGRLTTESLTADPGLDSTTLVYDQADRLIQRTATGGVTSAFQYDANGNLTVLTDPDQHRLRTSYDANNHPLTITDQAGHRVTRDVDWLGRVRRVTDPNGHTTTMEYYGPEQDGRLQAQIDPLGRRTEFSYDAHGNVTTVTDPAGRVTQSFYDALDRPIRVVGPAVNSEHPVTCFTYTLLGALTQVDAGHTLSPNNTCAQDSGTLTPQQTSVVDDLGRVRQQSDPLGRTWVFDYDVHGNVTQVIDPKGHVTTMSYGYGGQLVGRSGVGLAVSYVRNALGQVSQATSNAVTSTYTYDNAHRVATVTDSRGGQTLHYAYTLGGRLLTHRETRADQSVVSRTDYLYDAVGRLNAIWAGHGEVISFVYDAGGRLTEQWLPNGVNTRYTYNPDNTLQEVAHRTVAGGTLLSEHRYTYDSVGNRATYVEEDLSCNTLTTATYTYDALNRLTTVQTQEDASGQVTTRTESYTYDALGNRLTRTIDGSTEAYAYDLANQLTAIHQTDLQGPVIASFAYDQNGNLETKTVAGEGTLTLTYDAWDQLIAAQKTWAYPESYVYDDQGRRIQKTVGASATDYPYDGLDIVGEYTTWGTPTAQYTHGPGLDAPLIRAVSGVPTYYHQDGLGSVVAMTDQTGQATGTARYDAWGALARQTGGIPQYGYTGREPDATGLIYYRARYYDPDTGRFTQRDPIGLEGGQNLYAYAGGDPVNYTDPLGATPFQAGLTNTFTQTQSYVAQNTISLGTNLSFRDASAIVTGHEITQSIARQDLPVPESVTDPGFIAETAATVAGGGALGIVGKQIAKSAIGTAIGETVSAGVSAVTRFLGLGEKAARSGAQSVANAPKLTKQLGSQEGVGELLSGGGKAIAGAGTKVPIRDVGRLVSEYGGAPGDWAKITSTAQGHLQTHAYRNVVTGEVVELKSIVP